MAVSTSLKINDENTFLKVAKGFVEGNTAIAIAPNYDYVSAVRDLYLKVVDLKDKTGRPALDVVTPQSVEKAIRTMLIKGLSPVKNQCYPIVRGNQLTLHVSYQGNKRSAYESNREVVAGSIRSQVIYEGDTFIDRITPDGRRELVEHKQPPFGKRSTNIIGAYAIVTYKNGKTEIDLMTFDEIKQAWAKSSSGGTTHKEFPHEMACKTVESRLSKKLYSATNEASSEPAEALGRMRKDLETIPEYDIDGVVPERVSSEAIEVESIVFEEELADLPDMDVQELEDVTVEGEMEIPYGDWKNKWAGTGEYEQVKGSYDNVKKTVRVRKVSK